MLGFKNTDEREREREREREIKRIGRGKRKVERTL